MSNILRRFNALTVADLRHELADLPDEALVGLVSDYGDRSHTPQLLPVEAVRGVSEAWVAETPYSESKLRLRDRDDDFPDDGDRDGPIVLVVLGSENMVG